jgi:hypothetical protein
MKDAERRAYTGASTPASGDAGVLRRKELALKEQFEEKLRVHAEEVTAKIEAHKAAELERLRWEMGEKFKRQQKQALDNADAWARKEVAKVKAKHSQKKGETAHHIARHLDTDGLSKAEIQQVLELEAHGWQRATLGQQMLAKHDEVAQRAQALSRAVFKCLQARAHAVTYVPPDGSDRNERMTWSTPNAADWINGVEPPPPARQSYTRTPRSMRAMPGGIDENDEGLGLYDEDDGGDNDDVEEEDEFDGARLLIRQCRQGARMLDTPSRQGPSVEPSLPGGPSAPAPDAYVGGGMRSLTPERAREGRPLSAGATSASLRTSIGGNPCRQRPVSAGHNPYKNIHSSGGPAGLASRTRLTPASSRPRSAHSSLNSSLRGDHLGSSRDRPLSASSRTSRPRYVNITEGRRTWCT